MAVNFTEHGTLTGWIEYMRKRTRIYAQLRWHNPDRPIYLGAVPDTATGLLELVLCQAERLNVNALYRLKAANKQARW